MHTVFKRENQLSAVLRACRQQSRCCVFLLTGVLLLLCTPLRADTNTLILSSGNQIIVPKSALTYAPSLLADTYSPSVLNNTSFIPLPEEASLLDAEKNYWFHLRLKNDLPDAYTHAEWVLNFPLLLTEVLYIAIDEEGILQKGKTGFFAKLSERTFIPSSKGNFAKIHLPAQQEVDLYFRLRCDRKKMAPTYDLKISSAAVFFDHLKNQKLFNGMFFGFVLLIFVYNLFLFLLARDQAFIYYSLYLLALSVFTLYNSGELADWLMGAIFPDHPQWIYVFKLSLYFVVIGYLTFLRSFLDLNVLLPAWDRFFRWFSYLAFVFLAADGVAMIATNFNYNIADAIGMTYMIAFLFLLGFFLWILMKTDDSKRYFIIAGVIAMGIGISLTLIDRMRTIEFSTLAYKIGTIIEVVIFSLGLVFRQRETEEQKQKVQFALQKATLLREQQEKEAAQLVELHATKEWFYTHITHELRTPLTVIMGMVDHLKSLVKTVNLPSEQQVEWESSLALIDRNSTHLHRQVNQLLELAKLEAGAVDLLLVEEDVITYLSYLTESFYSLASDRGVKLSFVSVTEKLKMPIDELKIQQVIYNLLSNAIKFSQEGGEVKLKVDILDQGAQKWLEIQVMDTGLGIPEKDISGVFDPFFRATNSDSSILGTGVGLTLTRQLVELMSGEISVASTEGEGSCFTVLLPLEESVATPILTPIPNPPQLLAQDVLSSAAKTITAPVANQEDLPLLLIVEDNHDVAAYLEKILAQEYEIIIASNGLTGIELATENCPDLIISDVMMPEVDGYELCRQLKSDLRTSHIPIILLTAKADEKDKLAGLTYGADAYLTKPFNREELLLRMKNLQTLKQQLQQRYQAASSISEQEEAPSQLSGLSQQDRQFLIALKTYVWDRLNDEKLSAEMLAEVLLLSSSQFYRKLKALTGQTPTQYIRDARLTKAKNLLRDTSLQIAEIAYQTGFTDPNYFSRAFHQYYDASPREYRRSVNVGD
jgi:signal transduction histidine kinase/DNA-binding response OmpR family regulator